MAWKKLSESELDSIAAKVGLRHTKLYVEFMKKRFPDEGSESYAREWAERFLSGDPTSYMDSISLKAYQDTINKLRKIL